MPIVKPLEEESYLSVRRVRQTSSFPRVGL